MAAVERVYAGAAGRTRTVQTSVLCECGTTYGAAWHRGIDASEAPTLLTRFLDQGFSAINAMKCPECGAEHLAEEAVVVHQPARARLLLVVPTALRHRAHGLRAELMAEIAANPGDVVPGYALEPELVVGHEGLREALRGAPRAQASDITETPEPRRPEPEPAVAVSVEPELSSNLTAKLPVATLPAPEESGAAEVDAVDEVSVDLEPPAPPATPAPPAPPPLAVAPPVPPLAARRTPPRPPEVGSVELPAPPLEPKTTEAEVPKPPVPRKGGLLEGLLREGDAPAPPAPAEDSWDSSVDAGWVMPDEAPTRDDDPTHVVHADEISGGPAPRHPAGPAFDDSVARGRDRYAAVTEEGPTAFIQLDPERATGFEEREVSVRFQLHQHGGVPVPVLLLAHAEDGAVVDHVFWALDKEEDAALLEALEAGFDVRFVFNTPEGEFHGRQRLRASLEANVASVRQALDKDQSTAGERTTARRAVSADDYDRIGRLRHNFAEDSFAEVVSAADARLALGIVSYWSAPERRDYLLRVQSFPEVWYDAMVQRVLAAALEFGLAMEPHQRQRALEMGLARSSAELLRTSLSHFAEVNINLRPSGLDPIDVWENWEALLAHAEELDLRVDADIEELAARAMERARDAAQAGEPVEINVDEDSIDLEEVRDLGELSDVDLVGLLDQPASRVDAAIGLLHRAEPVYVPAVFDAIKSMSRAELLRTVPAALAMGPAFEGPFVVALRSRRISLRLAAALFLAEIRSERAATPILGLIPKAADEDWPALARAAARIGRRILQPAIRRVERDGGDPGDRVAFTLALLGPDARGALGAARDQHADAAVKACLTRAIEGIGEVSFGDAADFTERLAEAFAAAGPDEVGPDFEEDLESVDLGPGASVGSLETDVDLDGLGSR